MAVVVASHVPGDVVLTSSYPVIGARCVRDTDYARALRSWWGSPTTVVNVEHDMEFSDRLASELLECPELLCTHAYLLYWASTRQVVPHYAHRAGENAHVGGTWISERDGWADYSGIGFCKIAPEARVGPLEECGWQHLDLAVHRAVSGRWHIHWPGAEHYHR